MIQLLHCRLHSGIKKASKKTKKHVHTHTHTQKGPYFTPNRPKSTSLVFLLKAHGKVSPGNIVPMFWILPTKSRRGVNWITGSTPLHAIVLLEHFCTQIPNIFISQTFSSLFFVWVGGGV